MAASRFMFTLIFLFAGEIKVTHTDDLLGKWQIVFSDGNTNEVEFVRDGVTTICNGMTVTREPLGWVYENNVAHWRVVAAESRLLVEQWPKNIARDQPPKSVGIAIRLSAPSVKPSTVPGNSPTSKSVNKDGLASEFPEFVPTRLKKDTPEDIKKAVELLDAKRKAEREKLVGEFLRIKREIENAKKAKTGPKSEFQTKKQQLSTIETYQRSLVIARSAIRQAALGDDKLDNDRFANEGLADYMERSKVMKSALGDDWNTSRIISADRTKVGEVGTLVGDVKVLQIVNDKELLAEVNVRRGASPITVWLKMPTIGLADGANIPTKNKFVVVGTKQFQPVVGATRTVFALKEIDLNLWIER